MPSRRSLLAACGLLASGSLAGCTDLADLSDLGRGPPAYTDWVYDAAERFETDRVGYASLDVGAFAAARGSLPDQVTDQLDRLDRQVVSAELDDLTRLTAVGFGSLAAGRAGGTLVGQGSFDPAALREEFRMTRDEEWTHLGERAGHDRWSFEAEFLSDLSEYRGPTQARAPSLTAGVALSEERVVLGAALDTALHGTDVLDATLDAREDPAARYVVTDRPARDLAATLEDDPFVVGVSEGVVRALAEEVPEDRPLVAEVLEGLRAIGLGTRAGTDARTTLALVYDPGEITSLETVRAVIEEVADGDDVGDDGERVRVGLARGGRVVVVGADIGPEELVAGLEGVEL